MRVKTRILCILASAMLLAVSFTACAEQLPSPTQPVAAVVGIECDGSPVDADSLSMTLLTDTEAIQNILAQAQQAEQLTDLFGEVAMQEAAAYLPEGYDAASLMLAECCDITVDSLAADLGDVEITLELPLEYPDDAVVLAMIGLKAEDAEAITWTPVPATIVEGKVTLTLSRDLLEQMAASSQVLLTLLQNQQ